MIGLVRSRVTKPPNPPLAVDMPPGSTAICFRSAPAQKMWPFSVRAPVRTPIHTSSFDSIWSTAASIPWATSLFTAFRASGRLIVMMPTLPCCS